ncbi:MAG: signal peptidase II, partial [Bacteroidetes bacterium]|nr:signal peptidase II [Bacteroidota bacterium]
FFAGLTAFLGLASFLFFKAGRATDLAEDFFDCLAIRFWTGLNGMGIGESISVIGDFLQITYVENSGMALGITFGTGKIFLSIFSIIASIGLAYYLYKLEGFSMWVRIGVMLIFAGAFGNLIDRVFYGVFFNESPLFYGRVVDFIQVDIPDINFWNIHYTHFPVFNVADSCVSVGVVLLLIVHKKIPTFNDVFKKKIVTDIPADDTLDNS